MKKHAILFVLISATLGVTAVQAQWAVPRYAISSAGFESAGGSYRLLATVGQSVVGAVGAARTGFWPAIHALPTDVEAPGDDGLPAAFHLYGNYPNPFIRSTTIRFDLAAPSDVRIEVLDVLGRKVWVGTPRYFEAGRGLAYPLDVAALASGVYVYRLVMEMGQRVRTASGLMTRVR